MAALLHLKNIALDNHREDLTLQLESGMQALCIASDDQELSHLLHLCTGMVLPVQGQVLLNGADAAQLSREQLLEVRRSFGIISGSGSLIANLKLWENITLPLLYGQGSIPEAAQQHAMELLTAFGYRGNLMALPGHLSLFERRMAAFIRAAIGNPCLMVYAGCFDNLTADQRSLLFNQAQRLQQTSPGLASLYLTTSSTVLKNLQPDISCNLKLHVTPPVRTA